jgi:hypothetical protein
MPLKGEPAGGDLVPVDVRQLSCTGPPSQDFDKFSLAHSGTGESGASMVPAASIAASWRRSADDAVDGSRHRHLGAKLRLLFRNRQGGAVHEGSYHDRT